NVALLNFAYDVPVKWLAANLLLASTVLIVPDVRRLVAVFVQNRPAEPADIAFVLPRWLQRIRRYLKPIIVAVATAGPLAFSAFVSVRLRQRPALYGIYQVDRF